MTIAEAYDPAARERWQPLSDGAVVAIAIAAIGGGWAARWPLAVVFGWRPGRALVIGARSGGRDRRRGRSPR